MGEITMGNYLKASLWTSILSEWKHSSDEGMQSCLNELTIIRFLKSDFKSLYRQNETSAF